MYPLLLAFALLLALPALAPSPVYADTRPELRAFWVDGFNDGFKTPAQCDTLLSRLRTMHCNAVFVQMRKRADAYYDTHYEQWAKDDPDHFDALAYLCEHAHEAGHPRIQVHAWINACAVGGNPSAGALAKVHPEWLSISDNGADFDKEATKIDPGNPEAAEWTVRVYMDVVRHYDVDGIHMDFIRYGGDGKTAGHWGYNAVSIARYNKRYGTAGMPKWDDPRWEAWRREQVTDLVRRVYVTATALKPKLIVSAATICWGDPPTNDTEYEAKSAAYTEVFASWRDWMKEGILDLNCPMTYVALGKPNGPSRWTGWDRFAKNHVYGRLCAPGIGLYQNSVAGSLGMIQDTRTATAEGHRAAGAVLYCYDTPLGVNGQEVEGDTTLFAALPNVFGADVLPPPMPWKTTPTTGQVLGTLLAGTGLTPSDGTPVTLTRSDGGVHRTERADGNGVFAFTKLPPGSYTVAAAGRRLLASVTPGHTARLTVVQNIGGEKAVSMVTGIGANADGTRVVLGPVRVSSGSDALGDHFYVSDGPGETPIAVSAPHLIPPAISGDRVVVSGTLRHTPQGVQIDADAVRMVGMEIAP